MPHHDTPKVLALIDGHALAYRMYFALERTGMATRGGEPTWAIYGFFNALFRLLQEFQPDGVAVAFDVSRESFRTQLYADYKAHRAEMPDAMRQQMSAILEGVTLLGIPLFQVGGVEADDVIGTLSAQALQHSGWRVEILTGDQDAFQLVTPDDRVVVLVPSRNPGEGLTCYDWAGVQAKWGVTPQQVVDFKGLKGDPSDNIPGVPGVGDKTAVKLLEQFETLEALYDRLPEVSSAKLREKLTTFEAQARLSKQLATIVRSVPEVTLELEACHLSIPDWDAVMAFFKRYDLNRFMGMAKTLLAPFAPPDTGPGSASSLSPAADPTGEFNPAEPTRLEGEHSPSSTITKPDLTPVAVLPPVEVVTKPERWAEILAALQHAQVFAMDWETTGLDVHTVQPVGLALAWHTGGALQCTLQPATNPLQLTHYPAQVQTLTATNQAEEGTLQVVYVPLGHNALTDAETTQLPVETVLQQLKPLLADETLVKVVHNLKYETNILRQWGVPLRGLVWDTLVASYVLQPERRHGLKALALDELGIAMTDIEALIGKGKTQRCFSQVPLADAAIYAGADAAVTWLLASRFAQLLDHNPDAATLFYELELPVAGVLAAMEWNGVALEVPCLATLSKQLGEQIAKAEQAVYALAGEPFNLNSPKQVGDVFFGKLGIPPLRKTASKGGYSTDASVLEKLAPDFEIVAKLLEYRQLFKLKSTYVDALPQLIHPKTGRIHTSFNQTITATGRLSSSEPNLQNIPIRTDWGRLIREAFVFGLPTVAHKQEGWLLSADYSQIELRILAHLSGDERLLEAFNSGQDVHTQTAALVFAVPVEAVTKQQRYQAKAVNFGIVYGQTAHGLSEQLGISRAEAQQFIDRYFQTYPAVLKVMTDVRQQAHRDGVVKTLFGRTRNLKEGLASKVKSIREFSERAAFNTPIQGTAADLMKLAMVRVQQRLQEEGLQSRLILQVHDEIVLEVPDTECAAAEAVVRWAMELEQPLRVPLVVDVAVGRNWVE